MGRHLIKKRAPFSRRHLSIIFILLTITALFVLMGFSINKMADTEVYVPDGNNPNIMHSTVPSDGTRPSDHNALDTLSYAAERIYSSSYFKGETIGTVVSDVGIIKHLQNVHNVRVVKGDYIFAEAISSSTLKSVAEQKFFAGKDTILYRPATKVNDGSATFADSCSKIGLDDFYARYGVIPNEITKHIINTETILSIRDDNAAVKKSLNSDGDVLFEIPQTLVPDDDGYYRFTLVLDPDGATKFYRNEVMTLAGANYIKFKSVSLTFTIDESWYPVSVVSSEVYDISIPSMSFLGTMTMTSTLTETFTDINDKSGVIPEYDFFSSHFDAESTGGELPPTLGPSDYLAEAFGPYLAGKDLDLEARISINGKDIGSALNLSVNLDTMVIKAKLDALFIQYGEGRLYVNNNNLKGYVSIDKAKELLNNEALKSLLGDNLDFDNLFGDDLLGTVMANCEMTTDDDGITTVRIPFSLGDGIDIDAALIIGDGMTLSEVTGTVNLNGTVIEISALPKSTTFPEIDKTYKDISGVIDIASAALGTVFEETRYGLKGSVDVLGTKVNVDAYIDRTDGIKVEAVIGVGDINVTVKYIDGTLYAELYNVKVKASGEDIPELISAIGDLIDTDTSILDRIKPLLPDSIVGYLGVLDNLDVTGNTMTADLNLLEMPIHIELRRSGSRLTSAKLELNAKLLNTPINLNAYFDISKPITREVTATGEYIDANELIPFIPYIAEYINADGLNINLEATVGTPDMSVAISGNLDIAYIKTDGKISDVALSGTVYALEQHIDITLADGVLYAALGNIKLKLDLDDTDGLTGAITRLISAIGVNLDSAQGLTEILKSITVGSVKNGSISAALNLNGTVIALSVSPKSGAINLGLTAGSTTVNADMTLTAVNSITPITAPEDAKTYSDITELSDTLDAVANIIQKKGLSAPITLSVGDFTLSAVLSLDFTEKLAVRLNCTDFPLSVVYTDGTAYITLGGVKISCDKNGLTDLLASLTPVLPDDITDILSSFDEIDIADTVGTVLTAIKEFNVNSGILNAKIDVSGTKAHITLSTDLSFTAINASLENTKAIVTLGKITAAKQTIAAPEDADEYIPAQKLSAVLDAVLPLASAEGYKLSFNGTLLGINISGGITVALPDEENSVGVALELNVADVKGISVTLANGVLYVVIPDTISVSCGIEDDLVAIIDEIKSAIPEGSDSSEIVIAITEIIDAFKSAEIADIIGGLYGVNADGGFTLGCDFNSIGANISADIKVALDGTLNGLSLNLNALGKTVDAEVKVTLGENGAIKSITAITDSETAFTLNVTSLTKQTVSGKNNCISIKTYSQLISPILSLIETHSGAKTVSLDVNASITKKTNGNYVDIACKNLTISFGEQIAVRATITLFSSTDAAQDVTITYVDGIIYIEAGTVALSFDTTTDIERIYTVLEKYLPAYLAEELNNLLGLGDGTSSFSEIGLIVDRITAMVNNPTFEGIFNGLFTDLGALSGKSTALTLLDMVELSEVEGTPVIHATVMGITLKITPMLVAVEQDEAELQLVGAEVSTEILGMIVVIKATDGVSHKSETAIYPPTDRQYVSVMEFVSVIDMAIGTFTTVNPLERDEITFDIPSFSFTYDVYATETDPADTIKVTGRENSALKGKFTKHTETTETGEEKSTFSVALEAHISLDMLSMASKTGVIDIDLYIIDRYPEAPVAYLGYVENGTGYGELVSIDFTSVMQIVAAVMDIIGVDDETAEALVGSYRLPIDKTVFGYMSIAGLDKVKTVLNDLASALNNATVAIDEVKTAVDLITNAGSFDGLKNSLDEIKDHIAAAVELFGISLNDEENEYVGAAVDGSMFKRIVGGVAFGYEDNNLWADISNEITTGADGTAKIIVYSDGNVLNEVSVTNLDAATSRVDMDVKFVAGGTVKMSPIPTKDQYKAKVDYSDLGNIKHLLFDVMNTANLAEFEIGGGSTSDRIKLSLSLIGIINDSISIKYNVKVKLLTKADRRAMGLTVTDNEPEVKTAAFVELIYDDCKIVLQQAVGDCTTRLYFFDDLIYIDGVRSWEKVTRGGFMGIGGTSFFDCKREYRVYTLDDLSAMFADPTLKTFFNDFLFLLVPLSKSILGINMQQVIIDEVAKSATEETDKNPTIATVFKGYNYDGAKHTVSVGLKELTGSTALSDITVSLTGANDGDDNILDNYITAAQITTGAIGVSAANVKIDLTATLRNVQEYTSEDGIKMIRSKGLTSYTIHDVYLDNNKKDVGKNVSYPDIMSLLIGELPIAGSSSNPWQYTA